MQQITHRVIVIAAESIRSRYVFWAVLVYVVVCNVTAEHHRTRDSRNHADVHIR